MGLHHLHMEPRRQTTPCREDSEYGVLDIQGSKFRTADNSAPTVLRCRPRSWVAPILMFDSPAIRNETMFCETACEHLRVLHIHDIGSITKYKEGACPACRRAMRIGSRLLPSSKTGCILLRSKDFACLSACLPSALSASGENFR